MNPDYEKQLEEQIDRELKRLPELSAPNTLAARVMQAIELRASLPWYRQPWQMWPAPWRFATLAFLLLSFGGLFVASWRLTQAAGVANVVQEVGELFSGVHVIWNVANALCGALMTVIKQLGSVMLIGILVGVLLAWAMCLGVGTVCVRLALARR